MSRGENITNYDIQADAFTVFRGFPFYRLKHCVEGGTKLRLITCKYPGGVMVLLIMSWGNNDLIKGCPGGDNYLIMSRG